MTALILYAVALFGFVYVVGQSAITLPTRKWLWQNYGLCAAQCPKCKHKERTTLIEAYDFKCNKCSHIYAYKPRKSIVGWFIEMIECPACMSFHVGWLLALFCPDDVKRVITPIFALHQQIIFVLFSTGASAIIGLVTTTTERNTK